MWPYPKVLAHRGGGKLAPENTLAALACGLSYGFHAVEFDVMLARDGVPVVMHDPFLGRTVPGSGNVYDYDAAELVAMDAGSWFAPRFRDEKVPLYTQFVDSCREHNIWMNVEIKPAPGFEVATGRAVATLTRAMFGLQIAADDPLQLPLFSSFSFEALEAAALAAPDIPRALLVDEPPRDWVRQAAALGAVAIHANHKRLTPQFAREARDAGLGLFCYTVNDPVRAREILDWGVDAFCTDRIDLIGPDFVR
ncbi:glycerophosphodiester phosphodiesterase [Massilia cavernae]|uniref:Glycerophosphodiester phosphodiesterase n=1 Tax=Massilia cavernae TaxID=2320864 RepID=A0A418XAN3_9BURK|nr:glycerophosphodiester phosphodiesterase [Massilia cavernae]RJG09540.1 glycerophosphodiester phosphodiesterase [Massilia cavernae]